MTMYTHGRVSEKTEKRSIPFNAASDTHMTQSLTRPAKTSSTPKHGTPGTTRQTLAAISRPTPKNSAPNQCLTPYLLSAMGTTTTPKRRSPTAPNLPGHMSAATQSVSAGEPNQPSQSSRDIQDAPAGHQPPGHTPANPHLPSAGGTP